MSLAAKSVEKSTFTWFATFLVLVAGTFSFFQLGQLEDPEFTVKSASVMTPYPGASAEEVELEVTDRIEQAIQQMSQVKYIRSMSRPGSSLVKVEILPSYESSKLPQIWDELRKKVGDVQQELPEGAGPSTVFDDVGDVYAFLFALAGDGFDYSDLEEYADELKKEINLVDGVAKVILWGVRPRCIYIDVSQARLTNLGLTYEDIKRTLGQQNMVVYSGGIDISNQRLRVEQTGDFRSPEEIGNLMVRGSNPVSGSTTNDLIRIRDFATVRRGYAEPPSALMRYGGYPAVVLAVSTKSGVNVVDVGRLLDRRVAELNEELPIGVELSKISWQSDQVIEAVSAFMISLVEAVVIVLAVLWIAMGFRVAVVVGLCGLVFTIVASFVVMYMWGIDLQRMSLGALIIAMGMMVDNAIVVADGVLVRLQKGMDRVQAAIEAATLPSMPLLGATIIAVVAFYPIYASTEGAGEYCASLFQVVAISLMLSWVLSVTVTPLMCIAMLPVPKAGSESADPYAGGMYGAFRGLLRFAIRRRIPVVVTLLLLLAASGFGFQFIDKTFFPDSARLQFMIDYWAPEGTRLQTVAADSKAIEERLLADERVTAVSTFVGQGPPRFYLPVEPEDAYAAYAQLIVNVKDLRGLNSLIPEIESWIGENVPQAIGIVRRYGLGPSKTWKVEWRISGPTTATPAEFREVATEATDIVKSSPNASQVTTNWRQRNKKIESQYDQKKARWAGVWRSNVADAFQRSFDGLPVGRYREADKSYPILLRHNEPERAAVASTMGALQIQPAYSPNKVPLDQVTSSVDVEWDEPIIWRRDRKRTITIQATPPDGVTAAALRGDVVDRLEAMTLPPGFTTEWGGEFESARDSQQSLIPGMVPAFIIMALIVVALFNAYRPPLIILFVIPFAAIGVTVGLLVTDQPFGFLALLGAMSLAGMMIKNAIVLLDQINIEREGGKEPYDAVVTACVSRLRPVMLAAGTTVLGVIPLLQDVFWVGMAVTIMFGLAFGSLLTMVFLPVLYSLLYRIKPE